MSKDEIMEAIVSRAHSGPFTFAQLHSSIDDERAYRMADRYIQKMRKKGLIAFKREGRQVIWEMVQ